MAMKLRIFFALLLVLPAGQTLAASTPVQELDRVVAVVNDDVIVQSELDRRVRTVLLELRKQHTAPPPMAVLRKQVLERLILDRIQLQLAAQTGIRVEGPMLNTAISRLAQQNGLTVAEFKDILEKDGYDFAAFRDDIAKELTLDQLRRKQVENHITVTDREIDDMLATQAHQGNIEDEYRVAQILISVPEAASPEQIEASKTKAEQVLKQLKDGADFHQTAVAVSDGQQALEGGDLGWRKDNQLPTLFAEQVLQMKKGQISDLIRSPSGFHIVKLMDVRSTQRHLVTQTHVRHILIKPDEMNSAQDVKVRLEQLKQRIEGGDDFATLARSHSMDAGSAVKGGDLGWISPGDVVPEFESVMNGLKPGQVSEPFQTPFGWHIVQVLGRRTHDSTQDLRRATARDIIRRRKVEEEVQAWLRRLRDEAYVQYKLDE